MNHQSGMGAKIHLVPSRKDHLLTPEMPDSVPDATAHSWTGDDVVDSDQHESPTSSTVVGRNAGGHPVLPQALKQGA